jgi:hypothetical protein
MIILTINFFFDIYINVDENMISYLRTFTHYLLHTINININKNILGLYKIFKHLKIKKKYNLKYIFVNSSSKMNSK